MEVAELPRVTGRHRNKALAQERRTKAVELAVAGHSYQAIADQMGYANRGTVYRIVQEALKAHQATSIDEVRELEATRLDALQAAFWPDAMSGSWQAGQTVLKIMEQRAKLLGLHAVVGSRSASQARNATIGGGERTMFDFAALSVRGDAFPTIASVEVA
jgi:hypothetical protein